MNKDKEDNQEGVLSCKAKNNFVGEEQKEEKKDFPLSKTAEEEREILKFWEKENIFQKSIDKNKDKEFIFYDGPPFATGLPHYGHLLAGTIKDVIPRYKTMKGYRVPRNWGWDCHGLPVENMIEKELNLNSREEIEKYGINNFNQKCRDSVLRYDQEWKEIIPKTGRWVDMKNPYKTMDSAYIESLWWAFSELNKKKLVSHDFKPMHICPRCETTLSNNEVSDGYKDIKDLTVTAKFELEDKPGIFVLAWTTTPWTLPGNVALAVGNDIDYLKVKSEFEGKTNYFIVAKNLVEEIFNNEVEIIEEFKGEKLVGKKYKPLFDYYAQDKNLKNRENGWKIYSADFVTTEAGTGIVHIAPSFGEDDLKLGKENNLPWVQHVGMDGKFKEEVKDFSGMMVRKKEFHEESDIEIIKFLAQSNKLFDKKKYEHSYPHCWRCDTPLLNYTTTSWFIKSPKIKDKLLEENKKISWVPNHTGTKRFHNWLEGTRDWAVSRSRYWGAPLPIWENKESGEYRVLGSLNELKDKTRSKNKYIFLRHGESQSNVEDLISSTIGQFGDKLTEKGREETKKIKKELDNVDIIFSSPFIRTKETAEIVAWGKEIIFDDRLSEINTGDKNGKSWKNFGVSDFEEKYLDVKKRVFDFIYEINEKHQDKKILIVSHGIVGSILMEVKDKSENVQNSKIYNFDFAPIPHNENYELDFHRPYIDKISFKENGKKFEFVKEVFDCWFESGSMPFASKNYPFSKSNDFDPIKSIGFPADFIAEGQDQTRGWFNTMLILSTALFGKSSFKNVVVNGTVLAEDGRKMSKSLKNYPDVNYILNSYGGDAMRLYLLSSSAVRAVDLLFFEKKVDEMNKKVVAKSKNVLAFYNLYKDKISNKVDPKKSKNILDQWILERTKKLILNVENYLEKYELDNATKEFIQYIEDLSTWYIRRSRDRFKGKNEEDRNFALLTTEKVLRVFAKTIAPFAPFLAEIFWKDLRKENSFNSVHLENWPEVKNNLLEKIKKNSILTDMELARKVVSLGLEARVRSGIKVRQPLEAVLILGDGLELKNDLLEIIKDELNIKNIYLNKDDINLNNFNLEFNNNEGEEKETINVYLDKNISSRLKKEGDFREFLRQIQILRKKEGLKVEDEIELKVDLMELEDKYFIENYLEELKNTAGVSEVHYDKIEGEDSLFKINSKELKIIIIK